MCYLGDTETQLNDRWSKLTQQLHGLAASLAQARQGYQMNSDPRYLAQVRQILPFYESTLRQLGDVAKALGGREMPSQFMKTLSDFSEWSSSKVLAPALEGAAQTVKALPKLVPVLAGAVGLFFLWQSGVLHVAGKAAQRSSAGRRGTRRSRRIRA